MKFFYLKIFINIFIYILKINSSEELQGPILPEHLQRQLKILQKQKENSELNDEDDENVENDEEKFEELKEIEMNENKELSRNFIIIIIFKKIFRCIYSKK